MSEVMMAGISRIAGIRGGRPCIEGTGIRVTDIVTAVQLEYSRDEIAQDFELNRDQVNAALTYYRRNKAALDADIEAQDETFERHATIGYGRPQAPLLP